MRRDPTVVGGGNSGGAGGGGTTSNGGVGAGGGSFAYSTGGPFGGKDAALREQREHERDKERDRASREHESVVLRLVMGGAGSASASEPHIKGGDGARLWNTFKHVLLVAAWTLVYYVTSALAGIWNKWLVDSAHAGVAPTTLTLLHLAIGLASDSSIRHMTRDDANAAVLASDHRRSAWDVVVAFLPISIFVTLSKLTTYLSYQYVSIALAHTAKASEPIFNVIVAALVFGEFHSRQVYLSLVPISLGIFLASVSDFSYNHTGFFIAVLSALAKVLQNIYTKRLMETGAYTFWEVHLYCGAASLIVLAPVLLLQQFTFATAPFSHFPVFALLLDSFLQWGSSVSSYVVLSLVPHLTATVINVMKRMVMIVSGDMFDGNGMGPLNIAGVCLAMIGIVHYNLVRDGDFVLGVAASDAAGGGSPVAGAAAPPPWALLGRALRAFFLEPVLLVGGAAWRALNALVHILPAPLQRSAFAATAWLRHMTAALARRGDGDGDGDGGALDGDVFVGGGSGGSGGSGSGASGPDDGCDDEYGDAYDGSFGGSSTTNSGSAAGAASPRASVSAVIAIAEPR